MCGPSVVSKVSCGGQGMRRQKHAGRSLLFLRPCTCAHAFSLPPSYTTGIGARAIAGPAGRKWLADLVVLQLLSLLVGRLGAFC